MQKGVSRVEKEVEMMKMKLSWEIGKMKSVSLRGALKGMRVEEQNITEAKKSLFRLNGG